MKNKARENQTIKGINFNLVGDHYKKKKLQSYTLFKATLFSKHKLISESVSIDNNATFSKNFKIY